MAWESGTVPAEWRKAQIMRLRTEVGQRLEWWVALTRQVIERKELSRATKLRVINAMVVTTLLYGRETWTLQKRHRSRIQAMEMRYLRKIGVTRLHRVSNEDIRRRLRVEAVLAVADRKKKGSGERGLKECHRSVQGGCVRKENERTAKKKVDRLYRLTVLMH